MLLEAIYHRPKQNWAYAYDGKTVHLRIRTKRDDVDYIEAVVGDKYAWEQTVTTVDMRRFTSDDRFDYWETSVIPPFRRLRYGFRLVSGEQSVFFSEKGFQPEQPEDSLTFFDFPFINPIDVFEPPAWVKDAVFYQIFPERFANGDPSLDPEGVLPWGGKPTPGNFFGGDLQGVLNHLDHLSELGVNAIYFNPLFEATTNHKYDTQDYMKVDPHFGTNEKLKELVDACHARGIRVLLDAVFNHSGRTFPPFVDAQQNGPASKYADWFYVREWPLQVVHGVPTYDTFAFEPLMPKLNTEHPDVKAYLFEVARYWIQEIGVDGWRLDVANEVDHQFWREFRAIVKSVNPEAYILGEIWHDSMMWLQGDQFDAVMNYPFTNAALDFFAYENLDASGFMGAIGAQLAAYPQQVSEAAFNLLGSHDTPRLLTLCDNNKEKLKLATLFKLTFPGAPCIYYGDEVGMDGGGDPDCRKCMVWEQEEQDRELLAFFREAIALRHAHASLRSTDIHFLRIQTNDESAGAIAYERLADGERLLIVMNAREKEAGISFAISPARSTAASLGRPILFSGFPSIDNVGNASAVLTEAALADPALSAAQTKRTTLSEQTGPSEWEVLFSGDGSIEAGSSLAADRSGLLSLSLPGYGYVILKQQQ